MFGWLFGKKESHIEHKTQEGFNAVKKDIDAIGKWIKHLDTRDKQVFDAINVLKMEISSIKDEIDSLREGVELVDFEDKNRQVFKKSTKMDEQTADLDVEEAVQTPVQTDNFYGIFKNLTTNERAILITLMNSDLKLSYEDLSLLLGKERSTIRGQINSIKQKNEGLIMEITEKNGKKRVYVPEEVRNKLQKYAKVRVAGGKKNDKN